MLRLKKTLQNQYKKKFIYFTRTYRVRSLFESLWPLLILIFFSFFQFLLKNILLTQKGQNGQKGNPSHSQKDGFPLFENYSCLYSYLCLCYYLCLYLCFDLYYLCLFVNFCLYLYLNLCMDLCMYLYFDLCLNFDYFDYFDFYSNFDLNLNYYCFDLILVIMMTMQNRVNKEMEDKKQ